MASLIVFGTLVFHGATLDNGVGLTPAMGYNTWDDFRCGGINASNVMKVADAFIKYGLLEVGYEYLGIDDCWAVARSKENGTIIEDPTAFPEGMKAVVDYVHSKGLKFGIYTDRGTATCVGRPGSQGFEKTDARTYADWGVDLVKEDSCSASSNHTEAFRQYGLMRDALNATGRPIYFALCGWSDWYAPEGSRLGNSWRYGYDVNDWGSAWSNSIASSTRVANYSRPGAWNDPDALIGSSPGGAVHLSQTQSRTQFSLWSIMAAPLQIGSNILNISEYDLETYKNTEVIAVDQDPLGIQGRVVWDNCGSADVWSTFHVQPQTRSRERQSLAQGVPALGSCAVVPACEQIWTRKLHDGYALAFVNYTRDGSLRSGGNGPLRLEECNNTNEAQLWNIKTVGTMSTIEAFAGDKGCWEVNGCNYGEGGSVDTDYGCKALPSQGVTDPCCSNMAFNINSNGTITSTFAGMCFTLDDKGGTLNTCNASTFQQWGVIGTLGKQQIVSGDGKRCISRGLVSSQSNGLESLSFDVKASLGWTKAVVRDLWAHKDLGEQTTVTVNLKGGGDSKMFKLTKPVAAAYI